MVAIELFYWRIQLLLRIVWRKMDHGYRLSAGTAWDVVCGIYKWEDYRKVYRNFDIGPCFKITRGVW